MTQNRRTFLKRAGTIAGVSAIAGCTGSFGSGNGSDDENTVTIGLAPDGLLGIIMDYVHDDTDILANELDEFGYTANVQRSWEDSALFAAGGPDFSTMSSLEAAQLGAEREMHLAAIGRISPQYMGWMVKTGGEYDPENTGGVQESIDKLVEDDALIGIGAWNGGHVPSDTLTLEDVYGYEFREEGGDFRVTTADYVAIPQLINDGELAAGSTSPEHGGAKFLAGGQNDLTKLFWGVDIAKEHGHGVPQLNSLIATQEFMDNHEDGARGTARALQEGLDWLLEDPVSIITEDQEHIEQLGVDNAEQAEYVINWGLNLEYDLETKMMFDTIAMDGDFIESDKEFIEFAEGIGFVPENWGDYVTFYEL